MDLNGTLIRDRKKDTILYAQSMKIRITDWFFLKNKAELKYIGLENAVIKQQRSDSVWNFQFIIDHFSSPKKNTDTSSGGIVLNFQKIDFKNITYIKNDEWVGEKMTVKAASMFLDADKVDLANNIFLINKIDFDKPYFRIEDFDGRRPPKKKKM